MLDRKAAVPVKRNFEQAGQPIADQGPQTLDELNHIIRISQPPVSGTAQAVLGEGPVGAAIAFVGEQPGNEEDCAGRPFVGPAGRLLDRAMAEVGIDRRSVYVTNAVKHFKFEPRGKRRIHVKPTAGEVRHYRPWLLKELAFVHPSVVVALGATAVLALAGKALPVGRVRGEIQFDVFHGYVTVHPSYLLRVPEEAERDRAYRDFIADLARIRELAVTA
jgi:DNA polymerase